MTEPTHTYHAHTFHDALARQARHNAETYSTYLIDPASEAQRRWADRMRQAWMAIVLAEATYAQALLARGKVEGNGQGWEGEDGGGEDDGVPGSGAGSAG